VTPFSTLSVLLSVLLLTLAPILLGGGRAYVDLLTHHALLFSIVGCAWTAFIGWFLRRIAEFVLLKRSGAKLRADG
jgi:hypothetical protein